jgi:hypothetical protein
MRLRAKKLADRFEGPVTTIRRASRTGRIHSERLGNMYRFHLDIVREAMQLHGLTQLGRAEGLRATAGESRRCAQPHRPRLGKTGALTTVLLTGVR